MDRIDNAATGLVLVVDDDDDIRAAIAEMLAFQGYRVVEAKNGTQALSLASELRPAVILLDHCMPEIAGADVFAHLNASTGRFAVVLMSATSDLGALARSVGAPHVLAKPFTAEQLTGLVGALMMESLG